MPIETCLSGNTLITLADKNQKRIDQLKAGDKILSYNFKTGENEPDEIVTINNPVHSNMVYILLENMLIVCTPDHPFYSNYGWVSVNPYRTEMYYKAIDSAREITKGMFLQTMSGRSRVVSVKRFQQKQTTYNISKLKKNTTYFANSILTSIENN